MQRSHIARFPGLLIAAVAAVALAACGSSSPGSAKLASKSASKSTSSTAAASSATAPAASGPGVGKPPVVIGDKNFDEEYLLGDLYQQALAAKGYKVTLKANIGSSEIIWKALTSGQIQMYPEYTGTLLTAVAGNNNPPHTAAQTYAEANAFANKNGYVLLNQTPFFDADGLATTKAYASAHGLKVIADLKKLGKVSYGAPAENRTRYDGLVGLEKVYGLHNLQFVPLAEGLNYKALDSGQVKVATIFTSDPQLQSGKYTVLTDTKKLFGFQNVAPVVKKSLITSEGPAFVQTLNKVSALLTLPAIIKMNAAVQLDQQSPSSVAHAFLAANGLG
jgi:osmoprotectant transport system substrate-binding protein